MEHRGVVRDVGYAALLAATEGALLVGRLVIQHAEAATGGEGRVEICLEVAEGRPLVPCNLALVGSGGRVRGRITTEGGQTVVCRPQLGAAHGGDQRVTSRRGDRFHPGVAVARQLR